MFFSEEHKGGVYSYTNACTVLAQLYVPLDYMPSPPLGGQSFCIEPAATPETAATMTRQQRWLHNYAVGGGGGRKQGASVQNSRIRPFPFYPEVQCILLSQYSTYTHRASTVHTLIEPVRYIHSSVSLGKDSLFCTMPLCRL